MHQIAYGAIQYALYALYALYAVYAGYAGYADAEIFTHNTHEIRIKYT
jgi:hypothetical protein